MPHLPQTYPATELAEAAPAAAAALPLLPRLHTLRVHKAAFYLLGIVVIYLLTQTFFAFRGGAA